MRIITFIYMLVLSFSSTAELKPLHDIELANAIAKAGLTIDIESNLQFDFAYKNNENTSENHYLTAKDMGGNISLQGIDVDIVGEAIRIGLPKQVNPDNFSLGAYYISTSYVTNPSSDRLVMGLTVNQPLPYTTPDSSVNNYNIGDQGITAKGGIKLFVAP